MPTFAEQGVFHVVVESPRGSAIKLKYRPDLEAMSISRPLATGLVYPYDWGFVPSTRGEDSNPIDAALFWDVATFPGVVVPCRALAMIQVEQNHPDGQRRIRNDRILALPIHARREAGLTSAMSLSTRIRKELEHFFIAATSLEGKDAKILGWSLPDEALEFLRASSQRGTPAHRRDASKSKSRQQAEAESRLRVHRAAVAQRHPAANDPVDEPESHERHRQPGDEDADAERDDDEEHAERDPQQPEPERADLPAEVRLQPGAARFAPLHVVQDDRDDRRPAGEERADDGRGAEDAGEQAERVQRVDDLRPTSRENSTEDRFSPPASDGVPDPERHVWPGPLRNRRAAPAIV